MFERADNKRQMRDIEKGERRDRQEAMRDEARMRDSERGGGRREMMIEVVKIEGEGVETLLERDLVWREEDPEKREEHSELDMCQHLEDN